MNKAPDFQQFWNAYALKRDRIAAERAWNKLPAKDKRKAIDAIPAYNADCARQGISRMYAQGYLSHRRFEDDFSESPDTASSSSPSPVSPLGLPSRSVSSGCAAAKAAKTAAPMSTW